MPNCYECDDLVEEYGAPVCLGCYRSRGRKLAEREAEIKRLKVHIAQLEELLREFMASLRKTRKT